MRKLPLHWQILIALVLAVLAGYLSGTEGKLLGTSNYGWPRSGEIDMMCGAATITLTRREIVDFSDPIRVGIVRKCSR